MDFTAAMKISNCRGLLASLLSHTRAPFQSVHLNVFISVSNSYMKVHKSRYEPKMKNFAIVVTVTVVVVIVAISWTIS